MRLSIKLLLGLMTGIFLLAGCSQPKVKPTPIKPIVEGYFQALTAAQENPKQIRQYYFMPAGWRYQHKVFNEISQLQSQIRDKKITLQLVDFKQTGRWGIAVLKKTSSQGDIYQPTWFFFYDGHWQIIADSIFHIGVVRNMMDLYREQEKLVAWYTSHSEWHAKLNQ